MISSSGSAYKVGSLQPVIFQFPGASYKNGLSADFFHVLLTIGAGCNELGLSVVRVKDLPVAWGSCLASIHQHKIAIALAVEVHRLRTTSEASEPVLCGIWRRRHGNHASISPVLTSVHVTMPSAETACDHEVFPNSTCWGKGW